MKTVKYNIDSETMSTLEKLHYENESYSAIIAFMLSQADFDINNPSFSAYNAKFLEANMKYSKLKEYISINYVKKDYPDAISWSADFNEECLIVNLPN